MSEVRRLQVTANGRYLEDSTGAPFFYLGDTAWELLHRLNREEADRYLSNRAAKGFTVIQTVALAEAGGINSARRDCSRSRLGGWSSRSSRATEKTSPVRPGSSRDAGRGTVFGTVVDTSGAAVPGVQVTLHYGSHAVPPPPDVSRRRARNNTGLNTRTDPQGRCVFGNLEPATYRVTVDTLVLYAEVGADSDTRADFSNLPLSTMRRWTVMLRSGASWHFVRAYPRSSFSRVAIAWLSDRTVTGPKMSGPSSPSHGHPPLPTRPRAR